MIPDSNTILVTVHPWRRRKPRLRRHYSNTTIVTIQHFPQLQSLAINRFKYSSCYCSTKASLDSTLSANTYSNTTLVIVHQTL